MKKLIALVLVGFLFFAGVNSVSAMSEADLKAKFEETLTLNGEKYAAAFQTYFGDLSHHA